MFDFSKYTTQLGTSLQLSWLGGSKSYAGTYSVFDKGYIPTSSAAHLEHRKKAYFYTEDETFWEIVITRLMEEHSETYALHESLADAVVIHAAGSAPIKVSIEGYLPSGKDLDTRVRFMKKYIESFRERQHQHKNTKLLCCIRNTTFRLQVLSISLIDAVETADFTTISISGIASEYNQNNGEYLRYDIGPGFDPAPRPTMQDAVDKADAASSAAKNTGEFSVAKYTEPAYEPYISARNEALNSVNSVLDPVQAATNSATATVSKIKTAGVSFIPRLG